jgi:hypothetical protein
MLKRSNNVFYATVSTYSESVNNIVIFELSLRQSYNEI